MRNVKVIYSEYAHEVDENIQHWLKTDEATQNINIISINGTIRDKGGSLTYILYETKYDGMLKS